MATQTVFWACNNSCLQLPQIESGGPGLKTTLKGGHDSGETDRLAETL